MSIGDLLHQRQNSMFVGREAELALLRDAFLKPDWQLVHIYGTGGMGKTTLLKFFASMLDTAKVFYLDGQSSFQSPNHFLRTVLEALRNKSAEHFPNLAIALEERLSSVINQSVSVSEVSDYLYEYALQQQGIILLLDTFEKLAIYEHWFREEWLPALHPLVKICIAGRYALEDQWLRDAWSLLIQQVELQPLALDDMRDYARKRGIQQQEIIESLVHFSGGVPLALTMACEIIVRYGTASFLQQPKQKKVINYLLGEMLRDIKEPMLIKYLEAASIVWRFDQELLQALIGEQISADHFRDFCRLPIVKKREGGWMLHDSVRQWMFTDLRSRLPRTFRDYQLRALEALRVREQIFPEKKAELAFEKLYLHEDDFVRAFCFQWDDDLVIRTCEEQDLSRIEELYRIYLQNQPEYKADDTHLELLIRPLWEITPASFRGIWKDEQLVAFCSCVTLTEETVTVFKKSQITAPAMARFQSGKRQCLVSIAGMVPDLEQEINGSIARDLAKILVQDHFIDQRALVIYLLPIPYWMDYLPLLGYERASWADSTSPQGVRYQAFQLDLALEDFPSRVDRMMRSIEVRLPSPEQEWKATPKLSKLTFEETLSLVKIALRHYSRLPLQPELVGRLEPLIGEESSGMSMEDLAQYIQLTIKNILQGLSEGTEEEQRYHQILHYAYIRKFGSHEQVAEYLNMSVPTYYRHLRLAVRRLAYELTKK